MTARGIGRSSMRLRDGGKSSLDGSNALADESFGPFRIVDIARVVQHIEHLTYLGYYTKQRIITSLTFLLVI